MELCLLQVQRCQVRAPKASRDAGESESQRCTGMRLKVRLNSPYRRLRCVRQPCTGIVRPQQGNNVSLESRTSRSVALTVLSKARGANIYLPVGIELVEGLHSITDLIIIYTSYV